MKAATASRDVLIGRLIEAIDDQAAHLGRRRVQLRSLADCLVERDERSLELLLEEIARAVAHQAELDGRLDAARTGLAGALGKPPDRLTLGEIAEALDEPARDLVAARRRQLIQAIEAFQQQHVHTSVLLLEGIRINRMLLEAVFPHSRGVTTYRAGGQDPWRPDTGLVDAER